jgi:hypothetical protein
MVFMGDILAIAADVKHIASKLVANIARFSSEICQN